MTIDTSYERLASEVLCPGFTGTTAPDWLKRSIEDGLPGAIYFGHNRDTRDPDGFAMLSAELRAERSDLILGIDEEGGNVTRLEALEGSSFPGAAQLGFVDDAELTKSIAAALGRRVYRSGATLVLAPVADVNSNPRNPVIGVRSFGDSPELVSRHVRASIEGLHQADVAACAKHFPGHGDTTVDSHLGEARVTLDRTEVESIHLPPFLAAIDAGVDAVMTAHVIFPEFGEEPATVNPAMLGWLRELGFEGVIMTDALEMKAISDSFGVGGGAVAALAAVLTCCASGIRAKGFGQDRATISTAIGRCEKQLCRRCATDSLAASRVEQAAERVRAMRSRTANWPADRETSNLHLTPVELAAGAARAITVRGPLTRMRVAPALVDVRRRPHQATVASNDPFLTALGASRVQVDALSPDPIDAAAAVAMAVELIPSEVPVIALCDDLADAERQRRLVQAMRSVRSDAVVLDVGIQGDVGEIRAPIVHTRGINSAVAAATAELLLEAGDGRA